MATISEIAGEYGIDTTNDSDPFAAVEQSTRDTLSSVLTELGSNQEELNAAKGFGRSTFHEAIAAKQQGDIITQSLADINRYRATDVINKNEFERGIISNRIASDVNTANTKELASYQQGLNEQTANADLARTQALDTSRASIAETAAQSEQQRTKDLITANLEASKGLAREQGAIASEAAIQSQEFAKEIASYNANLNETAASAAYARQKDLVQTQFTNGEISAATAFERQKIILDAQLQGQLDAIQKQADVNMANLPEELRLKEQYQANLLKEQARIDADAAAATFQNDLAKASLAAALGAKNPAELAQVLQGAGMTAAILEALGLTNIL